MIDYSNKKITIFIHISLFKGGIDAELLTLAYEPEAAAIYCKEYAVQKNEGAEGSNSAQTVFRHIIQTYRRIHEIRPMHPRDTTNGYNTCYIE
jgi:catabolite regulation protein CreA